jgi:membrane protein YdbS with pleckstrin-like domain
MSKFSLFHALFSTSGLLLLAYAAWEHNWLVAAIGFLSALQAVNHMMVYRELWRHAYDAPEALPVSPPPS